MDSIHTIVQKQICRVMATCILSSTDTSHHPLAIKKYANYMYYRISAMPPTYPRHWPQNPSSTCIHTTSMANTATAHKQPQENRWTLANLPIHVRFNSHSFLKVTLAVSFAQTREAPVRAWQCRNLRVTGVRTKSLGTFLYGPSPLLLRTRNGKSCLHDKVCQPRVSNVQPLAVPVIPPVPRRKSHPD